MGDAALGELMLHLRSLYGGDAEQALLRLAREIGAERRVGKECLSQCRSRWSPYH